ncbi:protein unc-93 homolog A-like [Saccoglossus kowalevskii]|uniref:Protein unc-93 homolog A-like n=1 Tax=Saccoglossus kowalevskii TaxID=10224 RepID=A0ABM0GUN3_SACKO|nr:PREDICTED: protein unc-93 homolog A-like [Saccoglossus kowalevskii]
MEDSETDALLGSPSINVISTSDIWPHKGKYWKNLLALSVAFTFNFTAFSSLQNLESSLNRDEGLGLASLSVIYGSLIVSCLIAPAIIRTLGLKWTMFIAILSYVIFTAANYHATFYTLIPASVLLGFGAGPLWASQGAYLTTAAINYAEITIELQETIINRFNGVFLMFFQSSQVWGNLMSSLIFHKDAANHVHPIGNTCGAHDCPSQNNTGNSFAPTEKNVKDLLLSVYLASGVVSALIILLLLDNLLPRARESIESDGLSKRLLSTVHLLKEYRMFLMVPLMIYSGVEQAYIAGDFTKSFISCTFGVQMVGYVMIAYGLTDAVSSLILGRIEEYVGRISLFILGAFTQLGLIVVMLLWVPSPDYEWLFFLIAALWGLGDAVWQTQIASFVGVLFPEHQEPAFSNYRLWQALGFTISFAYSNYLCVNVKLYLAGALLVTSMLMYGTVEYKIRHIDVRYAEI